MQHQHWHTMRKPIRAESGAAVAEPPVEAVPPVEHATKRTTDRRRKPKQQPRYNVVLWDDDHHTYAYVTLMMLEVFGYPMERGFEIAKEVDTQGRVIVLTTTKEHAELKRDQIHAYGKDALINNCKGSMWATIEPVE